MMMYFPDDVNMSPTPMTVKIIKLILKFMNLEISSPTKNQDNFRKRTEAMTSRYQAIIIFYHNIIINILAIQIVWH